MFTTPPPPPPPPPPVEQPTAAAATTTSAAAKPPDYATQPPENPALPPESTPTTETPATPPNDPAASASLRLPGISPPVIPTVTIPSYSRWFSFDKIHETERRFLPEFFFDPKSPSKNPRVYRYYRDYMIRKSRENPSRKITFTEIRRALVGDIGSIRRVFDFLEGWGLINYTTVLAKSNLKAEEKESKAGNGVLLPLLSDSPLEKKDKPRKICGRCKSVCIQQCFACDKADLILCTRCFVRENYQFGLTHGDFKRVDIDEEAKTGWTDKETLHLLEAILKFGDDWKKVAEHVGGRSEKDCVSRFIRLPFGEQYLGAPDSDEVDEYNHTKDQLDSETKLEASVVSSATKRRRLTPLADASNPIMAQAAFLSAIVGAEVAEAAAHAAVGALSDINFSVQVQESEKVDPPSEDAEMQEAVEANKSNAAKTLPEAVSEAQAQLEKEERDLEQSISTIIKDQIKEIQEKIVRYEESEMLMEKEWHQLHHMKSLLFADQLTILQHKAPLKFPDSGEEKNKMKTLDSIT